MLHACKSASNIYIFAILLLPIFFERFDWFLPVKNSWPKEGNDPTRRGIVDGGKFVGWRYMYGCGGLPAYERRGGRGMTKWRWLLGTIPGGEVAEHRWRGRLGQWRRAVQCQRGWRADSGRKSDWRIIGPKSVWIEIICPVIFKGQQGSYLAMWLVERSCSVAGTYNIG